VRRLRAASALALALASCGPGEDAPEPVGLHAAPKGALVLSSGTIRSPDGETLHAQLLISPVLDEPDGAPTLSAQAAALAQTWGEPRCSKQDDQTVWSWEGDNSSWELRVRGWPFLSDRDDEISVNGDSGFELLAQIDGEPTRIAAQCRDSSQGTELEGAVLGWEASSADLKRELAGLLPVISAHLGLEADHRIEQAVQEKGVRAGLGQITKLTSSFARLQGYETLLREADEPSRSELTALLRQAATDLPADQDMRTLLLEIGEFTFDDHGIAAPLLAAASTIEDDAIEADVLGTMLNLSDKVSSAVLAKVLHTAADDIEDDEQLIHVLDEASFWSASSTTARAAWLEALDTIEADAPRAAAVESVLSIGDASTAECLMVLPTAAKIRDEPLRAKTLRSVHIDELSAADVADAYVEALQALHDLDELAATLTDLLKRDRSPARLTLRWLAVAQPLAKDPRLAGLLAAVPKAHLADPAVKGLYQSLAESLDSAQQRQQALDRLKPDPPTTKPSAPR
jgi:hypothetical protein